MLQPIDRPLFWALIAVAAGVTFAALVGAGLFDHLFDSTSGSNVSQPIMSLIATLVGGFFALGGVVVTHFLTRRRAKLDQAATSRRYLKAVLDELLVAWNSYYDDIGDQVEDLVSGDKGLEWHYGIFEGLLPVYHGNVGIILNLEDDALRRQVVKTCTSFITLMDCFRVNNSMLVDCETVELKKRSDNTDDPKITAEVERCLKRLVAYGKTVLTAHNDVKSNIEILKGYVERATRWGTRRPRSSDDGRPMLGAPAQNTSIGTIVVL
jgi:hypothetical protein